MATAIARAEELSESEQVIIAKLHELGSATIPQLSEKLKVSRQAVWRHMKNLLESNRVEVDPQASAFGKAKHYRATVILNNGVDIYVDPANGGEPVRLSWNALLQLLATQPMAPAIVRQSTTTLQTVMELTAYAIVAADDAAEGRTGGEANVTEKDLMQVRGRLRQFVDTLERELKLGKQMLRDDRLWSPDSLWLNTLRKTDKPLTNGEAKMFAIQIRERFLAPAAQEMEIEDDD